MFIWVLLSYSSLDSHPQPWNGWFMSKSYNSWLKICFCFFWRPSLSNSFSVSFSMQYPEGHVSRSIYVVFRMVSAPPSTNSLLNEFLPDLGLAVWTTTPWTVPANAGKSLFSFTFHVVVLVYLSRNWYRKWLAMFIVYQISTVFLMVKSQNFDFLLFCTTPVAVISIWLWCSVYFCTGDKVHLLSCAQPSFGS